MAWLRVKESVHRIPQKKVSENPLSLDLEEGTDISLFHLICYSRSEKNRFLFEILGSGF